MFCSPGCRASDWHARLGSVAGAMGGRAGTGCLTGPKPKTLNLLRSCAPQQRRLVEEEVEGRAGRSRMPRASAAQRANRLRREQSRTVSTKGDWMPKIHGRDCPKGGTGCSRYGSAAQTLERFVEGLGGLAGPTTVFYQRPQGFKQESLESALSLEPNLSGKHPTTHTSTPRTMAATVLASAALRHESRRSSGQHGKAHHISHDHLSHQDWPDQVYATTPPIFFVAPFPANPRSRCEA